jgi:vitamin B12 transporter
VRVDDHSAFGTHWTFGANGTVLLVDDLRLRGSYGQGFKAPTLYQLYAQSYGNTSLRAETSNSYDVALEKGNRDGRVHGAVTWFHRDTDNLIDFVSCSGAVQCASRPYGTYANVSRARAQGIEVEADARPVEALQLHGAYTYTTSTNRTQGSALYGLDLARRPRHLLTASVDWTTPWHGLALGRQVRLAGASWDDAANTVHLPAM